jgi:hypothetical protein
MFKNKLQQYLSRLAASLAVILVLCTLSVAQKSVHVRTYTKKDGTVVAAHDRSAPKTSGGNRSSSSSSNYPRSTPAISSSSNVSGELCVTCERDKHGKIKRSESAKHEFMRLHPCPVTGRTSGKCSGYVIDHVRALAEGGLDDPSNMQWQTKEAAKAKDKTERKH